MCFQSSVDALAMNRIRPLLNSLVVVAGIIFCTNTAANTADRPVRPLKNIDVEINGSVIDRDTKKPVVGAYVAVIYGAPSKNPNILYSHCVKVKGSFVGADGTFRFAPEKLDDMVLGYINVVAPDYYYGSANPGKGLAIELIKRELSDNFNSDSVKRNLHSYQHQLLSHSSFDCWRAPTREDAAAAIPGLEILRGLFLKYHLENNGSMGVGHSKEVSRIIYLLNQLPSRSSAPK